MFANLYQAILYIPIFNLLVFFYNIVPGHDIALAITLLTIVIKIILSPFFVQSIKAQRVMQDLQPKVDALKEQYKDEKEKMGAALLELYKKEKVSPLSSCLPLILQLPFLLAVYQVFRVGLSNGSFEVVYPFITNPGSINPMAFGLIDFSKASIWMAVLAGAAQFIQSKLMFKKNKSQASDKNNPMAKMGKQMTYFMPIITVFIGASLPAGLTFYWFLITILGALQQYWVFKKMDLNKA